MSRQALLQASRLVARASRRSGLPTTASSGIRVLAPFRSSLTKLPSISARALSTSNVRMKGIMPDTENPQKDDPEPVEESWAVVEVTEDEFHDLADAYLDKVLAKFEEAQDQKDNVDVEYSAGVLTISTLDKGTYVLNKQPPNKQIWLSSPITGPKRYDWCMIGEGQNDKEGTGEGSWVYTRDGTSLSTLIAEELGVNVEIPTEAAMP